MRWVEFMSEPLHIGRQRVVFIKDHNGQQVGITTADESQPPSAPVERARMRAERWREVGGGA